MPYVFRETTRLRDVLGDQASLWRCNYNIVTNQSPYACEAELTSQRDNDAASSPEMDFKLFHRSYFMTDVLWLSSTVFISSTLVDGQNGQWAQDYCIELHAKRAMVHVYVYSLLRGQRCHRRSQQHSPSQLPMTLLRDLIKDLPPKFVSFISLKWEQRMFPPSLLVAFLSILRSSGRTSTSQAMGPNSRTRHRSQEPVRIQFVNFLNREQIDAVMAHDLNPDVMLDFLFIKFAEFPEMDFDDIGAVSRATHDALGQSSTVRHVSVPTHLFSDAWHNWDAGDVPFTTNPSLETLEIRTYMLSSFTNSMLNGISRNLNVEHLTILVGPDGFR
jgi:hypothetical protein